VILVFIINNLTFAFIKLYKVIKYFSNTNISDKYNKINRRINILTE